MADDPPMGEDQMRILQQLRDMKLTFDREQWLSSQEPHMQKRFEYLLGLQDKVQELIDEFDKERRALELKYRRLMEPHFDDRRQVVLGEKVPEGGEGPEKGVPGFWLKVLSGNEEFAGIISDKDAAILHHLRDIRVEHIEPPEDEAGANVPDDGAGSTSDDGGKWGYKLIFTFEENEFFEGTVLTKTYLFDDIDQSMLNTSEGTEIKWAPGKDPTQKVMKKKGRKGVVKYKTEPVESFFHFFEAPEVPDNPQAAGVDMEALQEELEQDHDLGVLLKDEMLTNAMKWYTGEAALEEGIEFGEDDDDDDDDDDDADSEEVPAEDEDDDDDVVAPPAVPKGQEQECKQQ